MTLQRKIDPLYIFGGDGKNALKKTFLRWFRLILLILLPVIFPLKKTLKIEK
jgi:hypothetical protein